MPDVPATGGRLTARWNADATLPGLVKRSGAHLYVPTRRIEKIADALLHPVTEKCVDRFVCHSKEHPDEESALVFD